MAEEIISAKTKAQATEEFRQLIGTIHGFGKMPTSSEWHYRTLFLTPYQGAYGIAGWVACVEGSPPQGTILIDIFALESTPKAFHYVESGRCRRITSPEKVRIVDRFYTAVLKGKTKPFQVNSVHLAKF